MGNSSDTDTQLPGLSQESGSLPSARLRLWDEKSGTSMKDAVDSVVSGNSEAEGFSNRKLIRPSLSRPEHTRAESGERRERAAGPRKTPPPEQTHAENFY